MIAVDTNVLVYAHFSAYAQHPRARERVARAVEGPDPWGLPVFALAEFVRVATHPRVHARPMSAEDAVAALGALTAAPSCRVLRPGPRFPEIFLAAVHDGDARGNLVFDAQIAALCFEQGVDALLTEDRDFARWPRLRVERL